MKILLKRFFLPLTLLLLVFYSISTSNIHAQSAVGPPDFVHVCPGPASPGTVRCHSIVRPKANTSPTGLSPDQIKLVYNFSQLSNAGAGETIAIVAAFDNPTIERDLGTFSKQYYLPECTTANGCFKKVNQKGGIKYPRLDINWASEIALDVEWVHAIAPGAKILLVEADNNNLTNMLAAEDYASAHADYVSNSWGSSETTGESSNDSHFARSGVSYFFSSGDNGTPAEYPSSSPNVISVGGTTLHFDASGKFTDETGWGGSGGGCSLYETANLFQTTGSVNCNGQRATPDVSLVADPASGVSIYTSTAPKGQKGWRTIGGTSAAAPMIAGRAAGLKTLVNTELIYHNLISYRDITSGNNGENTLVGYDLVTGRGSWINRTVNIGTGDMNAIEFNEETNRLYIANLNQGFVSVVDGDTATVSAKIFVTSPNYVGTYPMNLAVNIITNRVYVTDYQDYIGVVDGVTNKVLTTIYLPIASIPMGITVDRFTNKIYVGSKYTNILAVIDGNTNTIIDNISLGHNESFKIRDNPYTHRAYVLHNLPSSIVSVVDTDAKTVIATIPIGGQAKNIKVNPLTNRIYVNYDNNIAVIDGTTNSVVTIFNLGATTGGLCLNRSTNRIYVTDVNGILSIIDGTANTLINSLFVGSGQIDINPLNSKLYIASSPDIITLQDN